MRALLAKLALAITAPLLFFALLETGLRIAGSGRDTAFFIPDEQPGIYRTNPRFTELFFPASFGLKPLNFRLPKAKPSGSFRVFVIGESAAMGVPEPAFALAPQLQAQLRAVRPDRQIDVYNLGVTAINSHVVLPIVRQAVDFEPDLLVIYMGNNEVVGPYGTSSVVTRKPLPRPLIRAGIRARSTRTGQLLQRMLAGLGSTGRGFEDWRGMEMFAGRTVAADDPRLETVYENFSANLSAILELARRAGIQTVLSTVAVNVRDCSPFASVGASGLSAEETEAGQEAFDAAVVSADLGNAAKARELLERVLAANPRHADAHFLLGRMIEDSDDVDSARGHYLEALQLDALRFRADARINAIIRRAAAAASGRVTLVDAARELGSDVTSTAAPAGYPLFFEHVHYTWEGNFALARLLAVAAKRFIGENANTGEWLDSAACAAAVGYTEIGRLRMLRAMDALVQRPPFTGQLWYAADRGHMAREIAAASTALAAPGAMQTAFSTIENALRRDPSNPLLLFQAAAARMESGDFAGALDLHDRLAAVLPPSAEQAAQKSFALLQSRRASEAARILRDSAAAEPFYFQTYDLLANAWAETGELELAHTYFAALVERMPESRAMRMAYARVLARKRDWAAVEEQWRAVLQVAPDDESALEPLLERLGQSGKREAAVDLMLRAYAHNPRSYANNARLIQVFEDAGDGEETVKYMRALAASGPVNARLHYDLALNLRKLGRREEMMDELHRALRAAEIDEDDVVLEAVRELIRNRGG